MHCNQLQRILIIILFAVTIVSGCDSGRQKYSEAKDKMGTFIEITACVAPKDINSLKTIYLKAWEKIDYVEKNMGLNNPEGYVYKINNAQGKEVEIDSEMFYVLNKAKEYAKITSGAFDITVYPLIELWKESSKKNIMPSSLEISEAKSLTGEDKLIFPRINTVQLSSPNVKIDLGGIAAGYAVDEVVHVLKENGYNDFFLDDGGDIFVSGKNCEGGMWKVGVRNPLNKEEVMDRLYLSDMAIATSGHYEKYYEIQGKRFSHIFDPRTGYPQENIISSTAIAPTAIETDILSTSLCILSEEESLRLIESLGDGYACVLVNKNEDNSARIIESDNYKKFKNN